MCCAGGKQLQLVLKVVRKMTVSDTSNQRDHMTIRNDFLHCWWCALIYFDLKTNVLILCGAENKQAQKIYLATTLHVKIQLVKTKSIGIKNAFH